MYKYVFGLLAAAAGPACLCQLLLEGTSPLSPLAGMF